jgi:ribonuclease HI
MKLKIHTDGGSLQNPGQAASAFLIYNAETNELLYSHGLAIGIASNNVAEYTALIKALKHVTEMQKTLSIESVQIVADSELMIRQVNGIYKVKHADMKPLFSQVKVLEMTLGVPISYVHVLRDKNAEADALVKKALGREV